jgi:beta-lactamase class A
MAPQREGRLTSVSACCLDLAGGVRLAQDAHRRHYAASTVKLPLMIELFRMADAGPLDLDRPVGVRTTFASAYDGSPYVLDPDDVDADLAARAGTTLPVRELVERMITESSNEAANLLYPLVDLGSLAATLTQLGMTDTVVARPIGDRVAERAGRTNLVSAADLARLLVAIAADRAASRRACEEMLAVLGRQRHRGEIPAALPPGVRTASKNGWVADALHDAALVWPPDARPYALAVATSGMTNAESRKVIRDFSAAAYADRHATVRT